MAYYIPRSVRLFAILSLFLLASSLVQAAQPAHNSVCIPIAGLSQQLATYKCPSENIDLLEKILLILHNPTLINDICESSGDANICNKSTFSLHNELEGLANILQMRDTNICQMAIEDISQTRFYFAQFLKAQCEQAVFD